MNGSLKPTAPPYVWEMGDRAVEDLATHLRRVMQHSANAALSRLSSADAEDALTCAVMLGLAVEAGIKWILCKVNPVLLADRGSLASKAFLADPQAATGVAPLRTVGAGEAYEILKTLRSRHPRMFTKQDVDSVLAVRNAAVHLGVVQRGTLQSATRQMVTIVTAVLEMEGEDPTDVWRVELEELVESLVEQRATEIGLRVTAKRAKASERFADLRRRHGRQLATVTAAVSGAFTSRADDESIVVFDCPVCGSSGLLYREVTDSDLDFTGMSYPAFQPQGYRYAYPEAFECPVCGYELDRDEIHEDSAFEDELEIELEPSKEFYDALSDWQEESIREQEREEERLEWERWD